MGSPPDSAGAPPRKGRFLGEGDMVAERFRIDRFTGPEIVGERYLAWDVKNERSVEIHVLPASVIQGPNALERVKAEMRSASQLTHKNILSTYGMGQLAAGAVYIIGEHVEGTRLDVLLAERRKQGRRFSLRGAYSVIAHLCNALGFAHKTRIHGSLSPQAVVITTSGRVKIRDFPLSRLLYMVPGFRKSVPAYVQSYWAPEVNSASSVISHKADIHSLGVMLYELLTGELPREPRARASQRRPDLPPELDSIILSCTDTEPASRYGSVEAFKEELASLLERMAAGPREESETATGLDIEIDVDRPLSVPPPPAAGAPPPAQPPHKPPPPPAKPHPGEPGPGLPGLVPPAVEEPRPSLGPLNLDAIMASVQDQDAEKWMISKDKLDHGPFKTREVVQMIVRWEVEGHHVIVDIENGIRVKLREHDEFKEIVERARVAKVKHEEQMALEQSEKAEKRGGVAKIFVVLLVVGGIGLVVGSIFAGRAIYKAATEEDEQDIDELVASGELKIDIGQGGIVQDKKGRRGGRKGGGGGGGGGSYDDYMNQAVNLGDLAGDGGQTQLSQSQINAVMSSQGKALYPCIYGELKRDKSLKKVSLKFAIEGKTGTVKGVTVTSGGSQELQSCISGRMKKIKFPTFGAPRMGATFYFDVG